MQELLFLCHRIPYPPNKGDKVRAFHLLQGLARHYRVHLGTFVDDTADWAGRRVLNALCAEQCYRPLNVSAAGWRSVSALCRGEPLSLACYHDRAMHAWVERIMRERPIRAIVVFSGAMGAYAAPYEGVPRVLDLVDVDSEKWRQYAGTSSGPMRWIYTREGRTLLAAERALAASFDDSVFVSEAEAEIFRGRAPECSARVNAIPNGVDTAWFDPALSHPDPYQGRGGSTLVFTGAMDYRANIDAVTWFAHRVLPGIRRRRPDVQFCVVGARPARAVSRLARLDGVRVTGAVADIRPWLAHAALAVAPLRIARGLQNKVLEALAMARPVLLTPQAAAGLAPLSGEMAAISPDPAELGRLAERYLRDTSRIQPVDAARHYVLAHYDWDRLTDRFLDLLADKVPGGKATAVCVSGYEATG